MNMKSEQFIYKPPKIEVIEVEVEGGFCTSGYGPNSDDSEFGPYSITTQRRGTWGNLWE